MFCVGRGSTVNNDVLAAQRKHEKTPAIYMNSSIFCQNVSVLSLFHVWCKITVNTDTYSAQRKHDKTLDFCSNLMSFCVYSTRFTRFGVGLGNTVNCDTLAAQRKYEKTLDFYTDYPLFCILDVFLICFFMYFSTVKRVIFDHTKKQVNYSHKLRLPF